MDYNTVPSSFWLIFLFPGIPTQSVCSVIPLFSPCGGEHNKGKYREALETSAKASILSPVLPPHSLFLSHTHRVCGNSLATCWFMSHCCQRIISSWGLFMMALQVERKAWSGECGPRLTRAMRGKKRVEGEPKASKLRLQREKEGKCS